jgi:hypothetical protein
MSQAASFLKNITFPFSRTVTSGMVTPLAYPLGAAPGGHPWLLLAESPAALSTVCFPLKPILLASEAVAYKDSQNSVLSFEG